MNKLLMKILPEHLNWKHISNIDSLACSYQEGLIVTEKFEEALDIHFARFLPTLNYKKVKVEYFINGKEWKEIDINLILCYCVTNYCLTESNT